MSVKSDLGCLALSAPFMLLAWLFGITILYGIVVIIFRYAFDVHLWNPFGAA